jgi:mannose-6-phosphate isomerase-like protein (cupin superfamily)
MFQCSEFGNSSIHEQEVPPGGTAVNRVMGPSCTGLAGRTRQFGDSSGREIAGWSREGAAGNLTWAQEKRGTEMDRRRFVTLGAVGTVAGLGLGAGTAKGEESPHGWQDPCPGCGELGYENRLGRAGVTAEAVTSPETVRREILVRAGVSRRADGTEAVKAGQQTMVRSFDSEGRLAALVVPPGPTEGKFTGAPLHVHHDVDEWLYILAGEFVAEVGGKRIRLKTGDSLLMPMKIPHRWSVAGSPVSGAIHLYTPAGRMDLAFDEGAGPFRFEDYGMTRLGEPLTKEEITETK